MRFEVLGPIRVGGDDGEVPITASRERTLLAMLLLHANHTVPTTRLVYAIWSTTPPSGARNQLQGCVSRLRRQLAGAGDRVIRTDAAGYRATVEPDELDLLEFRRLVTEARAATPAGQPDRALECYRAALALWRGPALAGIDREGVRHAAVAVDEERTQVREERFDLELATGAAGHLVAELTELVREHPHRETLHRALMLALYRAGRQADALATYRHLRQLLHDDLGTEPGAELRRLHQAILNRDPALDPPQPAARLPAAAGRSPAPRELPADVAGFTGRADALKALGELLPTEDRDGPGPVVISAIAGTAGVGKTALAVHWAHRVADRFPDGQLFLNLRGHATGAPLRPIEALSALLRSLGTPPEQIPTDEAQAAGLYRTKLADRRVLVVLDNARAVDQVRPLLPGSPSCFVLVTSRDRLTGLMARDGAHRIALDVLTTDEATDLLISLLGPERVRKQLDATAMLARACAHLPLALRIAAAHLTDRPDLPISAYVPELAAADRLTKLRADGDPETAVRGTLQRSYAAIPEPTQRMFRFLGLVPGPDITLPAASALAGMPTDLAAQCLQELVAAHLLHERSVGRYTFHDLLRLYARQLAEQEDDTDQRFGALRRLANSYLCSADAATSLLYPDLLRLPAVPTEAGPRWKPAGLAEAQAWFAAELPNLVAVTEHAADRELRPLACLLADRLRGYLLSSHRIPEWWRVATTARAAAETEDDARAQTAARISLALLDWRLGDSSGAISHNLAAVDLAQRAGWSDGQAAALGNLGNLYGDLGRLQEAADHYTMALRLNRHSTRRGGQAINRTNLGTIHHRIGKLRVAADHHAHALAIYRRLGSAHGEATALRNLGTSEHCLGLLDHAHRHLTQALTTYRDIGDRPGEANSLDGLAAVELDLGRLDQALAHAHASVTLAADLNHRLYRADATSVLGSVLLRLHRPKEALEHHHEALGLSRQPRAPFSEAGALLGLADAFQQLVDTDSALAHARRALEISLREGYRVIEGQSLTALARAHLRRGDPSEAEWHARKALDSHRETGHRLGEARTLAVLGHIAHAASEPEAAQRHWREALALFDGTGAPAPEDLSAAVDGAAGPGATAPGPAAPG